MKPIARRGENPTLSLPAIGWCADGRADPITGLVAFPDFHAQFPSILIDSLTGGDMIGLAIGDVDNLKQYVENANESDPLCFGHLAGNAVMTRLGQVAQAWFWGLRGTDGLVSTFGGDEIIVALRVSGAATFMDGLGELRRNLNLALPCTVSFAATILKPQATVPTDDLYLRAMTAVDRCLFARKARRREACASASFLLGVDLADGTAWEAGHV